jgi:phosphoenolpyruvate synthase/pyruvate phosphate dikinase
MSDPTTMNQEKGGYLVHLGEDRSTQISEVGGKGASLGKLVNMHTFFVPTILR